MIEFPVAFVISLVALLMATAIGSAVWLPRRARMFLLTFLILLAVMGASVGTRYGYGIEAAARWQPVLAMMLPASLYLSFRALTEEHEPPWSELAVRHGWPVFVVAAIVVGSFELPLPIDVFVFASMGYYLINLVLMFHKGQDAFIYVTVEGYRMVTIGLGASIGLIGFVLFVDISIFISRRLNNVGNSDNMVKFGTAGIALCVVLFAGLAVVQLARRSNLGTHKPNQDRLHDDRFAKTDPTAKDTDTLAALEKLMHEHQLYRDSELTLARTARRLRQPAREVSRAVNRCRNENFSRFVNRLRVNYAKRMLADTDASITDVMLESGFITKSNFNAEFNRIATMTPTRYREQQANV